MSWIREIACKTEIGYFELPVCSDEKIVWFQILGNGWPVRILSK
jgi:hypothetical protein